ncbi:proteasome-activating nucleotidase [Pyrodictium occultum]|uniref:Proteasome-activating nucleotidase n=1 Tax=Pyrodictium occultum TaxID=2309 RepID=A0A0V8RVR3_PYROC|nr:proteasome-activating nucleotidase [Pyrodictium occultum]KSW12140.1 proteasome-activating nucleotidase [Pyrodictium occultum]
MQRRGADNEATRDYIHYLERRVRELEAERAELRRELRRYKMEVDKLLNPPLIEAVVLSVLPDGRVVVKSSTGPNLVVNVSSNVDVSRLTPGAYVALNQRGSTIVEVLPEREDPTVRAMEVTEKPGVTFDDIGGLDEQKRELYEAVILPLLKPEAFRELGIEPPKGVLLYGPPGCGKTLLAKAVATMSNATFIRVVASEFVHKYVGEGARIVREVFKLARRKAPSIIFIDEIDAIAAKRIDIGTSGEREIQRTLMQLLAELDGFEPLGNVKVIAATNRIDILDPALLRPGRFDRLIYVPPPDEKGRLEIFKIHTRRMPLAEDVDLAYLARVTEGATGADIRAIVMEAGLMALRSGRRYVSMEDFAAAVEKVMKKRRRPYAESPEYLESSAPMSVGEGAVMHI